MIDCIVIGDSWKGPWLARELLSQGARVLYCRFSGGFIDTELSAVYIGNGELRARAELSFGKPAIAALWDLSGANFQRARSFFKKNGQPHREDAARWLQWEEGKAPQSIEQTPALIFPNAEVTAFLESEIERAGCRIESVDAISGLSRTDAFQYSLQVHTKNIEKTLSSASVFIVSETFPRPLIRGLHEIWLPVTLNRFTFASHAVQGAVNLFQGGIDFAWQNTPQTITLGSYRNLFEDRAVGIRPEWIDSVSEKAVSGFFHKKGWVDSPTPIVKEISIESLSCDGLPFAGQLSAYPGVFLLSGFAARTGNFFFELSSYLAAAFTGRANHAVLGLLSPKRLI